MKPMICENIAPPEGFGMLHELSMGSEAKDFVGRTIHEAERGEGLSTFNAEGEPNSRTITLMLMMQARMTGEVDRAKMLQESDLVAEISVKTMGSDTFLLKIYCIISAPLRPSLFSLCRL